MSSTKNITKPIYDHYDVVIVGGAMIGSSIAWFLADNPDFNGRVLVVEKDPSYAFCSTSHTNSCIRQQFSQKINIRISQFAIDYIRHFREYMGNDSRVPEIPIHSFGYMYMADNEKFAEVLFENQKLQAECGAGTKIMTVDEIKKTYPFYHLDDILVGSHNLKDEGYFDGNTLFDWWKRSSREKGVEYISNEVVGLTKNNAQNKVASLQLKSGESIQCNQIVNASGPRAATTSRMAGIDIPVEPRKRFTFVFDAQYPLDIDLPLTIDPSGIHFRTDGKYYMAGCKPENDVAVAIDDFEEDHDIWLDKVWPAIAHRIPQFESIKVINSWAGHYAYNVFDQNAILGPHDKLSNFIFANGFSGHGFQQAPAVGRGTAEMIIYGEYRSLDLSALHVDRIYKQQLHTENAVI